MSAEARRWSGLVNDLIAGKNLSRDDAQWALGQVMEGAITPAQLAGFMVGLRAKGETVEELTGLVDAMTSHARRFTVPGPTIDVVGTGGDRHHTVNVSTMAAIVVAGTGATVVKHGNRAASSSSGTADVLEALGVRLDLDVKDVAELAEEVGITFCFALLFHPAMKHAAIARKELGVPSFFNFLGPLTNPASPEASAIGCADERMAPLMAGVLQEHGRSALVFRGRDGLDELAATAPSTVWEVRHGHISVGEYDWTRELGLPAITLDDLRGGSAQDNAQVVRDVLAGKAGPVRDTVLLNAGAALVSLNDPAVVGQGSLVERIRAGMERAADAIDSGTAADGLDRWIEASQRRAS